MKRYAVLLLIFLFASTTCNAFEIIFFVGNQAGAPARWNSNLFPVGYSVHSGGTQGISSNAVAGIYKKVIRQINLQSPLKFKLNGKTNAVNAGDLQNGIIFDKNFGFGSFALAVQRLSASSPTDFREGDLIFNDREYDWTKGASNVNNDVYNVFTVMLHEMGHGAGLGHTAVKPAVMFFQFTADAKKFHPDDEAGIKFIYKTPVNGNLPTLITPIDNTVHTFSTIGQASRALTFRWESSLSAAARQMEGLAANYTLVFAGNAGFTVKVTRINASSKESFLLKGAKLNKVKKIQQSSPTGEIFWRIEEKNGTQTKTSSVFRFQIA